MSSNHSNVYELTSKGLKPIVADDIAIGQRVFQAHRYEQGVVCELATAHGIGVTVIYPDGSESQSQRLESRSPFTRITLVDGIAGADEVAALIQKRNAKRISDRQERDQAARQKEIDTERIVKELREKYPWAKTNRASANIKRELQKAFPGVKFSVRYSSFSGGDDVTIHWTDGPTTKEVEKFTDKYQDGYFDGMEDIYNYDSSAFGNAVDQVLGRAKYICTSRSYSPRFLKDIVLNVCFEYHHETLPIVKEHSDGTAWVEGGEVPYCNGAIDTLNRKINQKAWETSGVAA